MFISSNRNAIAPIAKTKTIAAGTITFSTYGGIFLLAVRIAEGFVSKLAICFAAVAFLHLFQRRGID